MMTNYFVQENYTATPPPVAWLASYPLPGPSNATAAAAFIQVIQRNHHHHIIHLAAAVRFIVKDLRFYWYKLIYSGVHCKITQKEQKKPRNSCCWCWLLVWIGRCLCRSQQPSLCSIYSSFYCLNISMPWHVDDHYPTFVVRGPVKESWTPKITNSPAKYSIIINCRLILVTESESIPGYHLPPCRNSSSSPLSIKSIQSDCGYIIVLKAADYKSSSLQSSFTTKTANFRHQVPFGNI